MAAPRAGGGQRIGNWQRGSRGKGPEPPTSVLCASRHTTKVVRPEVPAGIYHEFKFAQLTRVFSASSDKNELVPVPD